MADEPVALVIDGPKRAAAGLVVEVHWTFFFRQCFGRGESMDEHRPVVLEPFELVYTNRDRGREDKVER